MSLAFVCKLWLSYLDAVFGGPSLHLHWPGMFVSGYSSNSHSPSPPSSSNAFSLVSSEQDNPSTSGCRLVCNKVPTLAQWSSASCCKSVPCTPSCYTLLATPPSALLCMLGGQRLPKCDRAGETLSSLWCTCIYLMYALQQWTVRQS